jgi:predicted SAM-dependent methyltransferase
MKQAMKQAIRQTVNRFGIDLVRIPVSDLSLYDGFPEESLREKRFYNVGAGLFSHPYWINIDHDSDHYRFVQLSSFLSYNLMKLEPFPLEDNSAEIFYTSHTIEHVSNEAVFNLVKEAYRVLKPGGCIRLTTPDAQLEYEAYKRNDLSFWYWVVDYVRPGTWEKQYKVPLSEASIHQLFLHHFASQLCEIATDDTPQKKYTDGEIIEILSTHTMEDALDFFTSQCKYNLDHPGNHINWWTYEKLSSFLRRAGFQVCYKSGYGQSLFPPLRNITLFDKTHPKITLYVEAIK